MGKNQKSDRTAGIIMALCAGVSFAFGGTVSQIVGGKGYSVGQILFSQYLCGVILLGLLTAFRFREKIAKKDIRDLFLLGMINAIPCFLYYLAIRLMSVAAGIAIQFQYVWLVVLFQSIVDRVAPKKRTLISAVLVIAGSVMASGMADELLSGSGRITASGVLCALGCAFFYAVFLFGNGRTAIQYNAVLRAFIESCGILTVVTAVQLVTGGMAGFDFAGSLPGCSLLGLLMTVIPITCIAGASSRLSGGQVAILTAFQMPVAVAAGYFLLGEPISALMLIGSFVIIAAIALDQH